MASIHHPNKIQPCHNRSFRSQVPPKSHILISPRFQPHRCSVFKTAATEVDGAQLEAEIMGRDRPIIVDFYATWCGPCLLLAKELEQVADQLGDSVKILKIDCDKNEEISSALQIMGLPTMIFVGMDPTKPALRTEGLLPAETIIEIVQKELMAPTDDAAAPAAEQ